MNIPTQTPSGNHLPTLDDWARDVFPVVRDMFYRTMNTPDDEFVINHAAVAVVVAAYVSSNPDQIINIDLRELFPLTKEILIRYIENLGDQ